MISGKRDPGHANSIAESCGNIAGDGSRCDSNPHLKSLPHHCCGEGWQKHWTES